MYSFQNELRLVDSPGNPRLRILFLLLFVCIPFLCQCHVWKAHKSMKEARLELEEEQKEEMPESAAYHLDVARGLLEAAEKQYEDADFTSATALAEQAVDQMDRSRKLRTFHKLVESGNPGGSH